VSLLNGGAAAYISAELANAEQTLASSFTLSGSAAASTPILGGLLGGGSGGGILGGILGGGGGGLLGGLTSGLNSLLGGFNQLGSYFSSFSSGFSSLFNPNTFISSLTALTGPINFGNLTPGISLTTGPFAPLAPTLNGIGLDLGSFISSELANGVTPTNLLGAVTGLFQDVPTLQGLEPLLNTLFPGLVGPAPSSGPAAPNPYVVLGDTTVINLNRISFDLMGHPFPILSQIVANQSTYGHLIANAFASDLQGFPANVPENIQLLAQSTSTFNPAALGQDFVGGITGYAGVTSSSLTNAGAGLEQTLPTANNDVGNGYAAFLAGNYYAGVADLAHAPLDLFITGFDTSHLSIGLSGTLIPPAGIISIAGPIGLQGPAGALLPILTATGQQLQGVASLIPAHSIPAQIVGNLSNAVGTLTNAGVSADFAVTVSATGGTLAGTALFGLPLQFGFALLGSPFAMLNGVAQGATAFGFAVNTGNALGAVNAIADMPAYALNGMLNGQILVDLPLPVAVDGVILPAVAHLPFEGLLAPPTPLTVTIPLGAAGITVPINEPLGGTEFGGLFPTLLVTVPDAIAEAITPS